MARLFKKATCIRIAMVLQLVLIAGAAIVFAGSNDAPRAMNGFLDLSKREWKTDGPISLKGEWYMYWGKLLKPQTHSELERSKDVRRS